MPAANSFLLIMLKFEKLNGVLARAPTLLGR
jgi:hypothetical protein